MCPTSDSSETVIDCLRNEARRFGIKVLCDNGAAQVSRNANEGFHVTTSKGERLRCDVLVLAIGGCRVPSACELATSLGHSLVSPVPSLFTFHIKSPFLNELAGISVPEAEASVPNTPLRERGALLITHWGLSGPVILRLSAWGARTLHDLNYIFPLHVNWLPKLDRESLAAEFETR